MNSTANIKAGLGVAESNMMELLQYIVNVLVIRFAAVVIMGFIIFFIVGATKKHKMGEEYQDDINKIIVAIIGLGLVVSFPSWGWRLIGISSDSAAAASAACMFLTRMW